MTEAIYEYDMSSYVLGFLNLMLSYSFHKPGKRSKADVTEAKNALATVIRILNL